MTIYFNKGKQYAIFQNENVFSSDVVCGIQQGSIHGSVLFILYINDISKIHMSFRFVLLADDMAIISSHDNIDILCSQASIEMTKEYNWFWHQKPMCRQDKLHSILS